MLEVYALHSVDRIDSNRYQQLLSLVSQEKRIRIERFIRWEDAQRTLLAELLVRYLICHKQGLCNQEIRLESAEYGKPFLANDRRFHFNLSHAGVWVVCAIDHQPVGIDVEIEVFIPEER